MALRRSKGTVTLDEPVADATPTPKIEVIVKNKTGGSRINWIKVLIGLGTIVIGVIEAKQKYPQFGHKASQLGKKVQQHPTVQAGVHKVTDHPKVVAGRDAVAATVGPRVEQVRTALRRSGPVVPDTAPADTATDKSLMDAARYRSAADAAAAGATPDELRATARTAGLPVSPSGTTPDSPAARS